jgi:class 3 adenylate cyclase
MPEPTSETLTFLFSDIEESTRLLRQLGAGYATAQARHDEILRAAFEVHGGRELDSQGDSFFVAFSRPRDAVLAAASAQQGLAGATWPQDVELRVRIGIHTGPVELAGERYVGLAVHRAARICAAGHGGQILLSHATAALLEDDEHQLAEIGVRDLGEQRLKDFERGVRLYQVTGPRLRQEFPALRVAESPAPALEPTDAARASDADRDQVVATLREHTAAGRLTLDEFSERTERAYAAGTVTELASVGRDLPAAAPAARRRRAKPFTLAVLASTVRTGRWRLPRFGFALVLFGDADFDLRQAELHGSIASLTAFVLFGNVDVYAPEGVEVDFGGFGILGHRREWGRDVPPLPGTPLVRVHVFSLFGTADLWRVPAAWVGRSFREVIRALRRGEQRALPPGD